MRRKSEAFAAQDRLMKASRVCSRSTPADAAHLEDLHWADNESLAVLSRLTHLVGDMPLLIIGSFRDDDGPICRCRFQRGLITLAGWAPAARPELVSRRCWTGRSPRGFAKAASGETRAMPSSWWRRRALAEKPDS